jgi:membrane protein
MPFMYLYRLLKATVVGWYSDHAPSMGAALAYYTIFSIAPLLLIVITLAGLVVGSSRAQEEIFTQLTLLMGDEGARVAGNILRDMSRPDHGGLAMLFSVGLFVFGATTVFAELQDALDRIWRVPERVKSQGLWSLLRTRVLSFGMMLGIAFLLLVSLVVSAALAALSRWWGPYFEGTIALLQATDFLISLVLITCLFALIYKIMPRAHVAWREVWIGATFTSFLFITGKSLIGLYIGKSNITSGFGAAASLVVMLIWVYYSSQIFLLGAEFTHAYSKACRDSD